MLASLGSFKSAVRNRGLLRPLVRHRGLSYKAPSEIQDGGRPPFLQMLNLPIQHRELET